MTEARESMGSGAGRRGRWRRLGPTGASVAARLLAGGLVLAFAAAAVRAGDAGRGGWLQAPQQLAAAEPAGEAAPPGAAAPRVEQPPAEPGKPIPLSFSIEYTLVSDYVWRGLNLSEYPGEGRERPNHQLNVGVSYDAGKLGTLSASFWFEWYAGQLALDPASDGHLQEVDYTLAWSHDIKPLAMGVEVGWIAYQFPQIDGDAQTTYEWYVSLSFDDSKWFGTEGGVLNPTVAYYMDVDEVKGGQWLELSIGHDFALGEMGCGRVPILKDLTITPSLTLGVNHRYFVKTTQLANLEYGLAASYDLGGAFGMPARCGSLSLTGFLNFSQALGLRHDLPDYNDELYGGVTLGYKW